MAPFNPGASQRYPGSTTTLFVSLYVILLAFFILLTSLGQIDDTRSRSVMDSLRQVFPGGFQMELRGQRGASEAMAQAEKLFRTRIERLDARLSVGGSRLTLGMPHTELFRAGTPNFSAQTSGLLLRLTDLMRQGAAGQGLAIGLEASDTVAGRDLGSAQLARLAAALEHAGIAPERITIALDSSIPDGRLALTLQEFVPSRRAGAAGQ